MLGGVFYNAKRNTAMLLVVELNIFGRIIIGCKITTYHVGNKSLQAIHSNFTVFCNSTTNNIVLLHFVLNLNNLSRSIITIRL